MAERIDDTGFGNIKVIQNEGLGYGVDAVLLASFAAGETGAKAIRPGAKIADLGSGSGIVGFILCHKIPDTKVTGIDKRDTAVDRATRAAEMNNLADRARFVSADVKNFECTETFDAVVSNPPYFRQDSAIPNSDEDKFIARHETTANLADFVSTSSALLGPGGDLYMVHRPDRLVDVFTEMVRNNIEPKDLQLVVPYAGKPANIVLIHGIKGAGRELRVLPEIAIHNTDGNYTDVIQCIYERR